MAERKVLNKYYPPDFDPLRLPKRSCPKNGQFNVVMMLPMSIRCNTCGQYIYKGKKFNSRKETVRGEEYLGIKIYRFYMKCDNCNAEFTIKTDPQHSDYVCECGAHRNFEVRRQEEAETEAEQKQREEQDKDSMRALENRTVDSKQEMDLQETLDELRELTAKNAKINQQQLLNSLNERRKVENDEQALNPDVVRAEFAAAREQFLKKQEQQQQRQEEEEENESNVKKEQEKVDEKNEKKKRTIQSVARDLLHIMDLPSVVPKEKRSISEEKKEQSTPTTTTTATTTSNIVLIPILTSPSSTTTTTKRKRDEEKEKEPQNEESPSKKITKPSSLVDYGSDPDD